VTYQCEFVVSQKEKKDTVILVAPTAHHTAVTMSCNGTSLINIGFSADQYQSFSEFAYSLRLNQAL
jgi:hypothetical protein